MSQHHLATDVRRENDLFIAKWLAHEIVSQGKSIEDAIANLREVVELYLEPPAAAAIPEAALEEIGAILRHYSLTPDTLTKELEELYDISLGTPDNPERLLTTEEVHEEVARRRGYASV